MNRRGATIALDQAAAGMVLAHDLTDAAGGVLLPAGSSLSEANLASLRRRGVTACDVLRAPGEDPGAAAALDGERRQLRLTRLFRVSAAEQATPRLLELLRAYRRDSDTCPP